jgi:S-adenosylhomocysteine hydrolase
MEGFGSYNNGRSSERRNIFVTTTGNCDVITLEHHACHEE